jgi:hypothetical protein
MMKVIMMDNIQKKQSLLLFGYYFSPDGAIMA